MQSRRLKSAQGVVGLRGLSCEVSFDTPRSSSSPAYPCTRFETPLEDELRKAISFRPQELAARARQALTCRYRGGVGSGAREAGCDGAAVGVV